MVLILLRKNQKLGFYLLSFRDSVSEFFQEFKVELLTVSKCMSNGDEAFLKHNPVLFKLKTF